jgi:hypothetical protein
LYRLYLLISRHKDNVRRMDGSRKARGIIHIDVNFVFGVSIAISTTLLCIERYPQHQLPRLSY